MTGVEHQIVLRGCEVGGITPEILLSKLRDEHTANVRHAVMYVLRWKAGVGLVRIGSLLNRDHSTVIHALRRIQELLEQPTCPRVIRDIVEYGNVGEQPRTWAPPEVEVAV